MMKEDVFENPVEFRTAVSSPHFHDRRVLQRAQRVVPLDEIRAQRRKRTLWFLSGAFAIAMMLGAASALLAVHIKRSAASRGTQVTIETASETTALQPETVAAIPLEATEAAPAVDEQTSPAVEPVVTVKKPQPTLAQRPRSVERDREALRARPNEVQPTEQEQLEQIREAVLYDQWQERRMRRAARRERRNRGERDLSHVDEIFEGPRRRERP